jgi:hypothetical protein
VWTTCMLCFQVLLLAGYAYAHLLMRWVPKRTAQALLHTALLAAAVLTLPILPTPSWQPPGGEEPIRRILLLVGATVGLPYLLLAATSPLLQAWYARAQPEGTPTACSPCRTSPRSPPWSAIRSSSSPPSPRTSRSGSGL